MLKNVQLQAFAVRLRKVLPNNPRMRLECGRKRLTF